MADTLKCREALSIGMRTDLNLIFTLSNTLSTCLKLEGDIAEVIISNTPELILAAAEHLDSYAQNYVASKS